VLGEVTRNLRKSRRGVNSSPADQSGVETIEWIATGALILVLALGMFDVLTMAGGQIGGSVYYKIDEWVARWNSGGSGSPGSGQVVSIQPSGGGYAGGGSGGQPGYYGPWAPDGGSGGQPGAYGPESGLPGQYYYDPYNAQYVPAMGSEGECLGEGCGPNLERTAISLLTRWQSSTHLFSQIGRILPHGDSYVRVLKGAPADLAPGRHLAYKPTVTQYTTATGMLKRGLSSGSAWARSGVIATAVNVIDYKTGWFNPENKGKPILSTDFAASVGVDTGVGVVAGAVGGAAVTWGVGALAAAGIAVTAPAWALGLAAAAVGTVAVIGVDYVTCKLTGTKATTWLKGKAKQGLDGGLNSAKKGWNGLKGLVRL